MCCFMIVLNDFCNVFLQLYLGDILILIFAVQFVSQNEQRGSKSMSKSIVVAGNHHDIVQEVFVDITQSNFVQFQKLHYQVVLHVHLVSDCSFTTINKICENNSNTYTNNKCNIKVNSLLITKTLIFNI